MCMKSLGVYIHIPFCVRKCNYCDFLSAPATKEQIAAYVSALKREIESEAVQYRDYEVTTVFLGGGTPSLLETQQVTELLDVLKKEYVIGEHAEITIEMNPGTATKEKLQALRKAGINRLSIGLQSANDNELRMLGRIHGYEMFLDTFCNARVCGFDNINIDLMSGLPGQKVEDWVHTLQTIIDLKPEHISAYSLIIEEGTEIYQNIERYPALPSEEDDRMMYHKTKELLSKHGYERYEISNYARTGYESRHNCVYWKRGDYVGFGLGASSMVANLRWKNTQELPEYMQVYGQTVGGERTEWITEMAQEHIDKVKNIKQEQENLTRQDCMEEFMFLGLRMMQGVSKLDFFENFGISMQDVYGDVLQKWENQNMLYQDDKSVRLTEEGIDICNMIFSDFLLD